MTKTFDMTLVPGAEFINSVDARQGQNESATGEQLGTDSRLLKLLASFRFPILKFKGWARRCN